MRCLVTGAAGFIGSHVCRGLAAAGHDVVAFDDLSEGRRQNLADMSAVRLELADIRDRSALLGAARGCSAIFHHAAAKSVERSIHDPGCFHEVNVRGTFNVLEVARNVGASVVYASSSSVYGDQERFPVTEQMEPRPRSPYAATKLAGEAYCRAWSASLGVPTISLRYFNVYGPGQDPTSRYAAVIPRFISALLDGSRPIVYGDGEQARDFTFIDDVVNVNVRAAMMPIDARGSVFNVAGGRRPTSVNDLLALIGELAGVRPDPIYEARREGDIRRSEADVSAARRVLGYDPKTDIREGLRRTVESFRSGRGATA